MRFIFLPAIALMNRLSYTKKFGLLWLLSLVAIAVVTSNLYVSLTREIHNSQRELDGIALATPISRAVQALQQRRGLYFGFLGRREGIHSWLATKDAEIQGRFNELAAKLPQSIKASDDWQSIESNWAALLKKDSDASAAEIFAAHTRLIDQLLMLKVAVSGEYVLPLDPQIDSSYLIDASINRLPLALEHLGQLRAYVTSILVEQKLSGSKQVAVSTLAAQLGDEMKFLNSDYERASQYNPTLRAPLSKTIGEIASSAHRVIRLVESEVLIGRLTTPAEDFFAFTTQLIDNSYSQMYESLLPTVEALIKARISRAEVMLQLSAGIASLLFLIVIYLSIGAYYATTGSILSLGRSARAFASGNLGERVALETRDELKQVGDSFNEMADGFAVLLAERLQDEARHRTIIAMALDAVVQIDEQGIITGWNQQAAAIFGWAQEEAIGRIMHELIVPHQYRQAHINGMKRFLASGEGCLLNSRLELSGRHRDGHEFPIELSITPIQNGARYEFSAFIRDITERKESETLIWRQANYDALTSLPNRRMCHDRLEQEIKKAARAGLSVVVMFVDLDRFKEVNDTLGHRTGDLLLVEAAKRISGCVREADTVARQGGDEFVVIMGEVGDAFSVERVAVDILHRLAEPFQLEDEVAYVSASIGITLYPQDATEIAELLKHADQAMYLAKNTGRNRFNYFTPELQEAAQVRLRLINDLRSALTSGQFRVHFQPIVDLATGRIQKAEALIRWQHRERGLVSPADFIPLAEQIGLIVPIGDWVIDAVCAQQAAWLAAELDIVPVAVNLSPVQFSHGNLLLTLKTALAKHGLDAKYLELELTETLVMADPEESAKAMHSFRNCGLRFSLDDFGTGYSSLAYLQRFPFDFVKIDRSFVCEITQNPGNAAIATAVIAMAHRLKLQVVAEGVETEGQLQYLRRHGCDQIQGYYFSPPVAGEDFADLLKCAKRLPFEQVQSGMEERTVLVVDDEPGILSSLQRLLRREGYRILQAGSGREGLEMLAMHKVQVIVSDQRMPGMSGSEFLSIVKELYPDTVRIILSGFTDLEVVTDAVNRGAVYKFLTKPWDDQLIKEHIRDAFLHYRPVDLHQAEKISGIQAEPV